jgi:hypothetical protein
VRRWEPKVLQVFLFQIAQYLVDVFHVNVLEIIYSHQYPTPQQQIPARRKNSLFHPPTELSLLVLPRRYTADWDAA